MSSDEENSSASSDNTCSLPSLVDDSDSVSGDEDSRCETAYQPGLEPYQFEPEYSSDNEMEARHIEPVLDEDRTRNLDWCTCENCQRMDRAEECVCFLELTQIVNTNSEAHTTDPPCITNHPGFSAVCLTDKWVLKTAWHQYRQQYPQGYNGPEHKLNRHIAYRQLVRWCWGVLGKEIRVALPSCAVCCIRAHFPPPGLEEDFIFEGFHFADE